MAAALVELLGDKLLDSSSQQVSTGEELAGAEVVGIYFSAHWCPPCRKFTPQLVETFNTLVEDDKPMKIVFCSADRDEAGFKEYFGEMDGFLAVPWGADHIKATLNRTFKVEGIPSLVLLDGKTGEAYNKDARGDLGEDPMGKAYPWKPPTFEEALGDTFVNGQGDKVDAASVTSKPFALYFSAHSRHRHTTEILLLECVAENARENTCGFHACSRGFSATHMLKRSSFS